jgi:hypothetical protein
MSFYYINTGSGANKGDGDSLRLAFWKINQNFANIGSSSTVTISDSNDVPAVDLKVYSGTFTLPTNTSTPVQLIEFDKRVYRSASIDIFAEDETAQTQDAASGYFVTWNNNASQVIGTGIVSLRQNGTTANANWDLVNTSISDNRVRIRAYNVSGSTSENVINWKAKVSLFRL